MKTLLLSLLAFATIGSLCGCYIPSAAHSFYKSSEFRPDATFKIISVNTDDILLGRLENYLLKQGFNLVSDNYLRGAIPAGRTTVTTRDTSYLVPNHEMMAIRFADDQPTDYVIKYQYKSTHGNRITFLNITVVNTETGKTEASFSFPENVSAGPTIIWMDKAFALFVAGLKK